MAPDTSGTGPLTEETVLRKLPSPEVEHVAVDGETVVYDSRRGRLHVLDRQGTIVWTLLDGVASLGQTSQELATAFGQSPEQIFADVARFAHDLEDNGLVERVR